MEVLCVCVGGGERNEWRCCGGGVGGLEKQLQV